MLELAVLGLLNEAPLHGYELRQRLKATLGTFRAFSYGSLYPSLRRMKAAGFITEDDGDADVVADAPPLTGRRGKVVYKLTAEGDVHQTGDARGRVGVAVVLDALDERRGAVADADDGYTDGTHQGAPLSLVVGVDGSGAGRADERRSVSMSSVSQRTSRSTDSSPCSCSWRV